MDSTESAGFSGPPVSACSRCSWRYVSGLCASAVGLCAAGWLALNPFAFGYWDRPHHGAHDAALTDLATAGALGAVSLATLACWAAAWRRRLRADGVLPATSRRQARRQARALRQQAHGAAAGGIPDPARVLDDLRTLLAALTADPAAGPSGASGPSGTSGPSGAWPDIPGPRSAPEATAAVTPATPEADTAVATPEATAAVAPATPEADAAGNGQRDGIAALESMLAGAELLMVGCGEEEEAW
jgi:hypothetical protein